MLAAFVIAPSCQTVRDPFPPQSAFSLDIFDSEVGTQSSSPPTPQIATWTVEAAYATDITGFEGTYEFLPSPPCVYEENILALVSFSTVCGTSGLTLKPDVARTAKIHLRFSRITLSQAERPDLSADGDPDGDGIPNASDNCPIVANPDQANVNADLELFKIGDACSQPDTSGSPTIPDRDLDGVPDLTDNCLWYASPAAGEVNVPPDSNRNGIGDACERVAGIVLPQNGLSLTCDVAFTSSASRVSRFLLDFGRSGVLSCSSPTNCRIDPTAIALTLSGTTDPFPCKLAP